MKFQFESLFQLNFKTITTNQRIKVFVAAIKYENFKMYYFNLFTKKSDHGQQQGVWKSDCMFNSIASI